MLVDARKPVPTTRPRSPTGVHLRRLFPLLPLPGCRYAVTLERAPGAPDRPPSAITTAVAAAPSGAALLGTIHVQSNNWQKGQDCEAKALCDAKMIGATHVVIRPDRSSLGRGPKCVGEAYYLAPK